MEKQVAMSNKQKYQLEFEIKTSPRILYNYLSTPSGLEEWFADNVSVSDGIYTFKWEGSEAKARIASKKDFSFIRFKWIDSEDDTFFQFEIVQDALTNDVALMITDFCNTEDKDANALLWETQIHSLTHMLGC